MNLASRRILARAGVTAIALAAAGTFFAAPAHASDNVDLAVSVTGTTISAGSSVKEAEVTITNKTAGSNATGVTLTFDLSALDQGVVSFTADDCSPIDAAKKVTCVIGEVVGGANIDLGFDLTKVAAGTPGKIMASVKHDGTDPDATNDQAEATVTIGGSGADFFAFAPDVHQVNADGDFTGEPITVGGKSLVWVLVANQGDVTGRGVRMTIKLPDHVTFTEAEPDCTHAAGDKTTKCEYKTIALVPDEQDTNADDDIISGLWFFFPVNVAADAPAPGGLTGGVATADAIAQDPIIGIMSAPTTVALPKNATEEAPAEQFADVDPTDNTDEFTVFVKAAAGSGGSLPITGVQVGVIGGVGIVVIAVGGTLLLLSRRRRIVTVAPDDESSAQ